MKMRILAVVFCILAGADGALALPPALTPYGFGLFESNSWLAGAVAGYNWQRGALVFGFEGDISATGLTDRTADGFLTVNALVPGFAFPAGHAQANIDWYGTMRGRFGWATGSFLFYGTAGLAYGNVRLTNIYFPGGTFPVLNAQISGVRAGWVAGAGIDYLLGKNLVLNLQYQCVDLGSVGLAAMTAAVGNQTLPGSSATMHAHLQAITIGVSWKFAQPEAALASAQRKPVLTPLADPWHGLYVGGRVGGDRSNSLTVTPPNRVVAPL